MGAVLLIVLLSLGLVAPAMAFDAEDELGNWFGITSRLRYTEQWSFFMQGELRTWEMASNLNETLFRFSGLYDFSPKLEGEFGYVRVDTWPYTDNRFRKFYENRSFQGLLIKTKWRRANLNHRFRLEQRWITTPEFGTDYSNRGRYLIDFTHPLKSQSILPGTNFVRVYNEIFVDFDLGDYWFNLEGGDAGLNQNRFYVGGGRQLTPLSRLQLGLLWQHRPNADFFRLVLAYAHNFDFR